MQNPFETPIVETRYIKPTEKTTICLLILQSGSEVLGSYSHHIAGVVQEDVAEKKAYDSAMYMLGKLSDKFTSKQFNRK